MTFEDVLEQVLELLQQEKRVSYRGIQRRVSLDEAYLADLKEELLFAHPEIADVDRRGLVWNDEPPGLRHRSTLPRNPQHPRATPRHTWPSASAPSKPRWKRRVSRTANASGATGGR